MAADISTMTMEEVRAELAAIGSVYTGANGWSHLNPERGKALVRRIRDLNAPAIANAKSNARPDAWGPKGEAGTIVCIHCGKRGQEHGTTCDHCGHAL